MNPTLLNLKVFCKKENIQGYSKLRKVEILKLLFDRNDPKCHSIVSHYLARVNLKELVSFYIFLNDCELKFHIANQLQSYDAIVWKFISGYRNLTEEFILDFSLFLNWDVLSKNPCLSEQTVTLYSEKINFQELSRRPNLSLNILRMFKDKLNWFTLSYTQQFSESFLREMITKLKITQVDWAAIGRYQRLSDCFLKDHMTFILENASINNLWAVLAECQVLSEEFILEHILELPWWTLCTFQKLSTRVILELVEIVKKYYRDDEKFWCLISIHQNLPLHFLRQHKNKINWRLMVTCKQLRADVIVEFKKEMDRSLVLRYQTHLSRDFIEKYLTPYTKAETKILCCVCLEDVLDGVKTSPCLHNFCRPCIDKCLELKPTCPYCRGNL